VRAGYEDAEPELKRISAKAAKRNSEGKTARPEE